MEHKTTLTEAARILTERAGDYGSPAECFTRIATVATQILGRKVSRYEVSVILAATKMGRAMESPRKTDTWIDAINYLSFCNEFVNDEDSPAVGVNPQLTLPVGMPTPVARAAGESAIAAALDQIDEPVHQRPIKK